MRDLMNIFPARASASWNGRARQFPIWLRLISSSHSRPEMVVGGAKSEQKRKLDGHAQHN